MSLKMKLTSTIMAFMLLASMLIVGVFAVKQTEFSVGGNIVFNATGINATISKGTLSSTGSWKTGDGTDKMKAVTINTEKSASQLAEEYESWSGLDLEFNEAGDDVTITFSITNNSTNADDSLVVYVNIDNGTSKNAVATVSNAGAIIAPNTTEATDENVEEFVITFHIIDKEVNASLEGFKIDFDIRYATVTAESSTETELLYEGFTYSIGENNTVSLTGYTTAPINLVVPAYLRSGDATYTVTSIGALVFYGCSELKSVKIPDSVTIIDIHAFCECSELTSIEIPDSVEQICDNAFYGCSKLTSIKIPNGVTLIGSSAFSACSGLTSIEIPNSVTSIAASAFSHCNGLENIVVLEGNTVYDSRENCNAIIETSSNTLIQGFKNTIITGDIVSIGTFAFNGISELTSVKIPASVTSIENSAFYGCTNLTTVVIDSSTIAGSLSGTSHSVCGALIANATKIYIKTDIVSSLNSYVTTNYTNVQTITSGEYAGYTCYSK